MVRLLHILGSCAMLAGCGVFGLCLSERGSDDPQLAAILNGPSAIDKFRQDAVNRQSFDRRASPLIVQAQAFALYLDPPKGPNKASGPVLRASSALPVLGIRPAAPSVKFRLHGTSYYPNQPDRSMALIGELGAAAGSERWVKEGAQLGHFVIHEIQRGAIVYRDGEDLREMAVERSASPPSLVRDLRFGSRKVSAAMDGGSPILPAPAGPNGVETAGGD
jgi:hypothetical protein